jgi:hypothetical protein
MTLLLALEQLQSTLAREYGESQGMFTELAHIEGLLAETYRGRIQYEMLHNSDDAGATVVDVALGSDGSVTWVNNGRPYWRVVTGRDFAISNRRTPWPDLESN